MQSATSLSLAVTIVWVFVGIVISLVLPVAVRVLKKAKPALEEMTPGGKPTLGQRFAAAWQKYGGNRYLAIVFAATVIAVVLVFLLGLEFTRPRDAVLAGFAWESLLSKLLTSGNGK